MTRSKRLAVLIPAVLVPVLVLGTLLGTAPATGAPAESKATKASDAAPARQADEWLTVGGLIETSPRPHLRNVGLTHGSLFPHVGGRLSCGTERPNNLTVTWQDEAGEHHVFKLIEQFFADCSDQGGDGDNGSLSGSGFGRCDGVPDSFISYDFSDEEPLPEEECPFEFGCEVIPDPDESPTPEPSESPPPAPRSQQSMGDQNGEEEEPAQDMARVNISGVCDLFAEGPVINGSVQFHSKNRRR